MAETACITAILEAPEKLSSMSAAVLMSSSSPLPIMSSSSSSGSSSSKSSSASSSLSSSPSSTNGAINNGVLRQRKLSHIGLSASTPSFGFQQQQQMVNINNNSILGDKDGFFAVEKDAGFLTAAVHGAAPITSAPPTCVEGVTTTAPVSTKGAGAAPPFKLVRPLGTMEDYIASYNERGLGDIVYALHLKSKIPIPDEALIKALRHWQTQVQHLRLAIQDDGYHKYFVELGNPEIVFKNCGSRGWKDLFEEMLTIEYDAENGPLWQARFTRMGPEDEASCQIVNGCVNHGYVLLIGFHHSITDGTSNAKFCTILLETLNCVLTGMPFPVREQLTLAPSMWDLVPENQRRFTVYDPRNWVSLAKDIYTYGFNERSQYLRRFPPPRTVFHSEIKSGICTAELSTEMTSELIRACKRKGVTVSGAFTAAAGIAMYNLVTKEEGPTPPMSKGKRKFNIQHAVNLRRYFDKTQQEACGCYFNFFDDRVAVGATDPEDPMADFWQVAGDSTESIKVNVENARGLEKQRNLDFIFSYLYPTDWYCQWRRKAARHSANSEFSTSNLGAVDRMFSGVGSPVETVKLYRSTAMHYLPSLYTWFFQTFRGRFTALLEFFTNFVTRAQAQDFIDETMRVLALAVDAARLPAETELMMPAGRPDGAATNGNGHVARS